MPKEALLIIDMLNDFVLKGAPLEVPEARKVIPKIKKEIQRAHRNKYPVLYLCDSHMPDDVEFRKFGWPVHAVRGTSGAEVIRELKPGKKDVIITKKTYSGFYQSKLQSVLKKKRIHSLRLTGCVTHICVLFTAADAVLRDYAVSVVQDGVAGIASKDHNAALRIMKNVLGAKLI
ncbi:MAG: cysteine hydrolase [Nitrospiraceae bacterium]|jgi:nicotinamidase-related amidase|nr:MAG: cysteine hydrolase [Nitrospiraceae bacterium]